jgi:integrase/recombinase XerD
MKADYAQGLSLYTQVGLRKYLNRPERRRVLSAAAELAPDERLFVLTLAWTGARVSEVLALTGASFQVEAGTVSLLTLKRRRRHVREVPIPPQLVNALDRHFGLSITRQDPRCADRRLWPWHRVTAWRIVKRVMTASGIVGRQACPRGLRHGFGVGTLQAGVPLSLTQRWLGHARISTTAIYTEAAGPEECAFAARFWQPPTVLRCSRAK